MASKSQFSNSLEDIDETQDVGSAGIVGKIPAGTHRALSAEVIYLGWTHCSDGVKHKLFVIEISEMQCEVFRFVHRPIWTQPKRSLAPRDSMDYIAFTEQVLNKIGCDLATQT